jgi:hypothetical protein
MAHLQYNDDLITLLVMIYTFVDDFNQQVVRSLLPSLEKPSKGRPPTKKGKLTVAEVVSLAVFRFFTGHRSWKEFYRHVKCYHHKDFPNLPAYSNFIDQVNKFSFFAMLILQFLMNLFNEMTTEKGLKFADSSKLNVCHIKREFTHKVCKGKAMKSKSTMGWFYGFKLHVICNELMHILSFSITPGNLDDRKGLAQIWNSVLGTIIADAGYIGKEWATKARDTGKFLITAVKANMKKLMTKAQHQLMKMRQRVETIFSVLKLRMGIESTLPRSPLGYFAHYLWCITAYQIKKFFEILTPKPLLT